MTEAEYDSIIAPKLMEIGKLCEEHGLSMVASVEYEHGKRGTTRVIGGDSGLAMVMLAMCDHAGENVDAFMINLMRHCNKHGIDTSRSMYLSRFGKAS